jgi:uncharacterized ubiquitin-like protein YukD
MTELGRNEETEHCLEIMFHSYTHQAMVHNVIKTKSIKYQEHRKNQIFIENRNQIFIEENTRSNDLGIHDSHISSYRLPQTTTYTSAQSALNVY